MDNILDDMESAEHKAEHDDEGELVLKYQDEQVIVIRRVREAPEIGGRPACIRM